MIEEPYRLPRGGVLRAAGLYPVWLLGLWGSGILGVWCTTQWLAHQWQYAPSLGPAWLTLWGWHLYAPWQGLVWAWQWIMLPGAAPLWWGVGIVLAGTTIAGFIITTLLVVYRARRVGGQSDLHGSARWATKGDIQKAGLLRGQGVYLGAWQDGRKRLYLQHGGPDNVLVIAPPRKGKTAGVIIPTVLTWPHSLLLHDPKSEVWQRTAGYRAQQGNICLWFNPVDETGVTAQWNPFFEVRPHPHDVRDMLTILEAILEKELLTTTDEGRHWKNTAEQFMLAAALHTLYAEKDKSIPGLFNLLLNPFHPFGETLEIMRTTQHDAEGVYGWTDPWQGGLTKTHPVVASGVRALELKGEREWKSVVSSVLEYATLFHDSIIAKNIRTSDFSVRDLIDPSRQVSLYLGTPSSEEGHLMPILRVFVNLTLRRALEKLEDPRRGWAAADVWRLGIILDEFPQMGKIPALQAKLSVLPGYGVKTVLAAQDLSQIVQTYGKEESITSTCDVLVVAAPNKHETAKWISEQTDKRTIHREQRTYSGDRRDVVLTHVIASEAETERPLLTPGEVRQLAAGSDTDPKDPGELLIFHNGLPILAKKIRYYQDRSFKAWSEIQAPEESDHIPHDWGHWLNHKAVLGVVEKKDEDAKFWQGGQQ